VAGRKSREGRDAARVFGENVARLRGKAGLSQEELAYRSSIHQSTIYLLENGKREPRLLTIVKVAGALGINPIELLKGLRWHPPADRVGELQVAASERAE
jgi:transcriptional regulator with XRE-family HTH domain